MTATPKHTHPSDRTGRLLPLTVLAFGLALAVPAAAQDQGAPSRQPSATRKAPPAKARPPAKRQPPPAAEQPAAEGGAAEAEEGAEDRADDVPTPNEAEEVPAETPAAEEGDDAPSDKKAPQVVVVQEDKVIIVNEQTNGGDPEQARTSKPGDAEREAPTARANAKRPRAVPPPYVMTTPEPYELEYTDGAEIPPGYELETRAKKGLVIAGAVTLGASWLASCAAATLMIQRREEEGRSWGWEWDSDNGGDDAPPETALYIPLAGPWIALKTMEDEIEGQGKAALVADGMVQAAGLAMLIGGLAARDKVLVKTETTQVSMAPGIGSVSVLGKF